MPSLRSIFAGVDLTGDVVNQNEEDTRAYCGGREERVLHGMTGSMLVDPKRARLHFLEGRLPQDMTIGFGLLARIYARSNFSTRRESVLGNEWKTATVDTDIEGRAIFFKSIGTKEHAEHGDFKPISMNLTVAQVVEMLEK
jgi:hypothetical protein